MFNHKINKFCRRFMPEKKDLTGNAATFEEVLFQKEMKLKRMYGIAAIIGVTISFLSVMALIVMLPLKRVDTRLISVDNQTGRTEEIVSVKNSELSDNKALARFFVKKYIEWRESYNYFRLQYDYDAVVRYSNDAVVNEYNPLFKGTSQPHLTTIYHKGEQTASVDVLSMIITESSPNKPSIPDKLAMVRLKKTVRDVISGSERVEYWNVRMTYRITPPNKEKSTDVDDNPLGFIVTSYQSVKES